MVTSPHQMDLQNSMRPRFADGGVRLVECNSLPERVTQTNVTMQRDWGSRRSGSS